MSPVPRDDSTPVRTVPQSIAAPIPAPSGRMHPPLYVLVLKASFVFSRILGFTYMLYVVLLEIEHGSRLEVAPCSDLFHQLVFDFISFRMLNMSNLLVLSIWCVHSHCIAQCRPISASMCMMCFSYCSLLLFPILIYYKV